MQKSSHRHIVICIEAQIGVNSNKESKIIKTKKYLDKEIYMSYYIADRGEKMKKPKTEEDVMKRKELAGTLATYTYKQVEIFQNGDVYVDGQFMANVDYSEILDRLQKTEDRDKEIQQIAEELAHC